MDNTTFAYTVQEIFELDKSTAEHFGEKLSHRYKVGYKV